MEVMINEKKYVPKENILCENCAEMRTKWINSIEQEKYQRGVLAALDHVNSILEGLDE